MDEGKFEYFMRETNKRLDKIDNKLDAIAVETLVQKGKLTVLVTSVGAVVSLVGTFIFNLILEFVKHNPKGG